MISVNMCIHENKNYMYRFVLDKMSKSFQIDQRYVLLLKFSSFYQIIHKWFTENVLCNFVTNILLEYSSTYRNFPLVQRSR